jgi:hypothetical protein
MKILGLILAGLLGTAFITATNAHEIGPGVSELQEATANVTDDQQADLAKQADSPSVGRLKADSRPAWSRSGSPGWPRR